MRHTAESDQTIACSTQQRHRGQVRWFRDDMGYGYILPEDGSPEIYVHFTGLASNGEKKWRSLVEKQLVEYSVEVGPKGPRAVGVKVIHEQGEG